MMEMLNDDDRRILKLKAAMWEHNSENRLLSKAIRAYEETNTLDLRQKKESVKLYISGQPIRVNNVPHIFDGNELFENLYLNSALEEVILELYGDQIPNELDFEELLN